MAPKERRTQRALKLQWIRKTKSAKSPGRRAQGGMKAHLSEFEKDRNGTIGLVNTMAIKAIALTKGTTTRQILFLKKKVVIMLLFANKSELPDAMQLFKG